MLNVHELDQRLRQLDDAVALLTVREALDAIDKQTFHSTPDYDDRNSLVRRTGSVHSSILDGDSGATQGELCCLFVNEAALEFNKMRNALVSTCCQAHSDAPIRHPAQTAQDSRRRL